jgi:bilin biosynthesis protein
MTETPSASGAAQAESLTPLQVENDALLVQVSQQIAQGTLDTQDQALFERLVKGFSDSRGLVRLRIAETLGSEIGEPTTQAVMAGLAHDQDPVVRRACGKTLTLIGSPEAIPVLIDRLLHDEDMVVHGSCAGALARIGTPAVPELMAVLQRPDLSETTKGHVMWALAFNALEAKETFYAAYRTDNPTLRAAMVGAIAKVAQDAPEPRAFELLVEALGDELEDVSSEAAAVLANLGYQPALPTLLAMLHQTQPSRRKAAALAIMKLGNGEAQAPLQAALERETVEEVASAISLAVMQLERKGAAIATQASAGIAEDDGWD